MSYDSTLETKKHINRVRQLLMNASTELHLRADRHDASKLRSPEKEIFDKLTPKLAETTYGSEEYKKFLTQLKPALDHHYKENSHHPEHYENGINGMDIFDLLEMLLDWKAATERHNDGDIERSIQINTERFKISPQLVSILSNTVRRYAWLKGNKR